MTRDDWDNCPSPEELLELVPKKKLTLANLTRYSTACCERIQELFPHELCARAIKLSGNRVSETSPSAVNVEQEIDKVREEMLTIRSDPGEGGLENLAFFSAYFCTFDSEYSELFQQTHRWDGVSNFKTTLAFFHDCAAVCAAEAWSIHKAKTLQQKVKHFEAERLIQTNLLKKIFG